MREIKKIQSLIEDIKENEWYCIQTMNGDESDMEKWEKALILEGLKLLIKREESNKKKEQELERIKNEKPEIPFDELDISF